MQHLTWPESYAVSVPLWALFSGSSCKRQQVTNFLQGCCLTLTMDFPWYWIHVGPELISYCHRSSDRPGHVIISWSFQFYSRWWNSCHRRHSDTVGGEGVSNVNPEEVITNYRLMTPAVTWPSCVNQFGIKIYPYPSICPFCIQLVFILNMLVSTVNKNLWNF